MRSNKETILIVVAHPDDEVLAMGGTICYYKKLNYKVCAMYFSDGISSRKYNSKVRMAIDAKKREEASEKAAKLLGFEWVFKGNFQDNAMDKEPLLKYINVIEKVKRSIKPSKVYTHSPTDLNVDHRIISEATLTAFRPQPGESCSEIASFEIPSSTDYSHYKFSGSFSPNKFIDISKFIDAKLKALSFYKSELRPYPHSRSLEGIKLLSQYRGVQVGINNAEAFEVFRKIIKI